jgi:hypothetical protein
MMKKLKFYLAIFSVLIYSLNVTAENVWPITIKRANAEIRIYQPQLNDFKGNRLAARAAVSVKWIKTGSTDYCAVWMKARVDTDKEAGKVLLKDLKITQLSFPNKSDKVKKTLSEIIKKEILGREFEISLDLLIGMLKEIKVVNQDKSEFNNPVPQLFFSTQPAALVSIDGAPVYKNIAPNYSRIINTDYLLVKEEKGGKLFLNVAGIWFSSNELDRGWHQENPPTELAELTAELLDEQGQPGEDVPKIFISHNEAALIQSYGEPLLAQIPNTNLSYLKNSDNDLFRDESTGLLYLLLSGRWFTAESKEGPWKYIKSEELPKDFKAIPEDSEKANVLASIAGTEEAIDAIMESHIPQTASIARQPFNHRPTYDGVPNFEPIESIPGLSYATNSDSSCVKLGTQYYLCYKGAWFQSVTAYGPWLVCTTIPVEIKRIPKDHPLYYTTYVEVYDVSDDYVEVGYTSGYTHSYISCGHIIYGTGWRRRWWCANYRCPRIATYGHCIKYNRYENCWYRHNRYRDRLGHYVDRNRLKRNFRDSVAALPIGAKRQLIGQKLSRRRNLYRSNPTVARNLINRKNKLSTATRNNLKRSAISKNRSSLRNNIYVGEDGKIYKHGINGWQAYSKNSWKKVARQNYKRKARSLDRNRISPPINRIKPRPVSQIRSRPAVRSQLRRSYESRQRGSYRVQRSISRGVRSRAIRRPR